MSDPVLDADGHVTESTEQAAKYLDAPYRRRPLNFPLISVGRLALRDLTRVGVRAHLR